MWECSLNLFLLLSLIKNQFQGLVVENLNSLGFLRQVGLTKLFLYKVVFYLFLIDIFCLCLNFVSLPV